MQSKLNKCDDCVKVKEFVDNNIDKFNSGFDLAIEVSEFIKNCDCEDIINEEQP